MRVIISFFILISIKIVATIFYRIRVKWISDTNNDFKEIRLVIFLNHTSLYEPIFIKVAPNWFIWRLSRKLVAPVADKTINRPIVGKLWKYMLSGIIPVTRKRDSSWKEFLKAIKNRSVIVIAPEGRMMRETGLDANGKKMSIRSGVAEIIEELKEGKILLAYSGGLHHVQHPGEKFPRIFKKISINLEAISVEDYKALFTSEGIQFRRDVVNDLEARLKNNCPKPN